MAAAGIVCEYNPFHLGHAHHIAATRAACPGAVLVGVMSGNFVQRGDAALLAKHARAEAALACGMDLIVELPLPWALSSAEGFARGAVSILEALGVETLSFGSESGDSGALRRTAGRLLEPDFPALLRARLAGGASFAAARQAALAELDPAAAAILSAPNDILGVEYCKAILTQNGRMRPLAVARRGAGHDEKGVQAGYASASHVRRLLKEGHTARALSLLPTASAEILRREMEQGAAPVFAEALDSAILAALRRMEPADFRRLPDVGEGLEHRLCRAAAAPTVEGVCMAAKTKRYAYARLRRILYCAFLGVEAGMAAGTPPYIRVLGFNARGQALLRQGAALPVIIKPAHGMRIGENAARLLALEARATDLWALACPSPKCRAGGRELRISPVVGV